MTFGTTAKVALISICSFVLGATVLSTALAGFPGLFAGPLFALFGWFLFVPVFLLVGLLWNYYRVGRPFCARKVSFILLGACLGLAVGTVINFAGLRGPERGWLLGYALGGLLSGMLACWLIAKLKAPEP